MESKTLSQEDYLSASLCDCHRYSSYVPKLHIEFGNSIHIETETPSENTMSDRYHLKIDRSHNHICTCSYKFPPPPLQPLKSPPCICFWLMRATCRGGQMSRKFQDSRKASAGSHLSALIPLGY
jgi:hypothetical protein